MDNVIRIALATGKREPQSFSESRFRNEFRKPNALLGTGFPGLTRDEYAILYGGMEASRMSERD